MEEELNTISTEIVDDMPDFGEDTTGNTATDPEADTPQDDTPQEDAGEKKEDKEDDKSDYRFNPLQIALRPLLEKAKDEDPLFALEVLEKESRADKPKSFAECCEYIMGEAYKYASEHRTGNFGLAGGDEDFITGMIKHYYDEDDIVIRKATGAKAKVVNTPAPKAQKKAKETPKPVSNTHDLSKVITANMKADTGKKKAVKKDNLDAGFVPMERPDAKDYDKEAKKGSRQQAKSVEQMDLGLLWD